MRFIIHNITIGSCCYLKLNLVKNRSIFITTFGPTNSCSDLTKHFSLRDYSRIRIVIKLINIDVSSFERSFISNGKFSKTRAKVRTIFRLFCFV
jgi:hypothetical protein